MRNKIILTIFMFSAILQCRGNSFGVYGENDALNLSKKIIIGLNNSRNYFYDCNRGIDLNGFYETRITNNYFHSNQVYTPVANAPALIGNYAVFVKSGRYINNEIDNNSIANWALGIVFLSEYIPLGGGQYYRMQGDVHIHHNEIASVIVGPYLTQYVNTAIIAHSLSVYCNSCEDFSVGNGVLIEYNEIHEVFNGVFIQGWTNHARVSDNTIWLTYRPNFGSFVFSQFGVRAVSNIEPFVLRNDIFGNTVTGNTAGKVELRGIYLTTNFKPYVRCNEMTDVGQCMVFEGHNMGIVWDNIMYNSTDGLVLLNDGRIGPQGNPASQTLAAKTCDNHWVGPFANSATLTDQTFTPQLHSPLYVRGNNLPEYIPPFALNLTIFPGVLPSDSYQAPGAIITDFSNPPFRNCNIPQLAPFGNTNETKQVLQRIVNDSIPIAVYPIETKWHAKQQAYYYLRTDTNLYAGDSTLTQFYYNVPSTNLGAVENTDQSLAQGMLLNAYSANQTIQPQITLEQNYRDINEVYLYFLNGNTLDSASIQTLEVIASQCPLQGGIAVYRARTLLMVADDQVRIWDDSCAVANSSRLQNSSDSTFGPPLENIKIVPNPNTGDFTVESKDPLIGNLVIYDLLGNVVHSEALAGDISQSVNLGLIAPGIYFYQVVNDGVISSSGRIVISR